MNQWLRERISNVSLIAGTVSSGIDRTLSHIATLIEHVRITDLVHRNRVRFPRDYRPDANFIWAQHGTGFVDIDTPGGR